MARIAGRNGAMYVNLTSGGTAEPVAFLNHWTLNFAVDTIDVTAFGDTNKVKVAGLPDASGSYSGFFDNATAQTYTAATDGVARKMYLYPDRTTATTYWFGTATLDMSIDASVDGAVTISGNFSAASFFPKVG
jgi:predicted secreted protein